MTSAASSTKTLQSEASFLSRLRRTPLRDIVRGRLTGRLDIGRRIAAFDLPPAVREVVRRVARRTRLWRIEKADVAEELAAHFADGLAAGGGQDELIQSFGDPARAARLIRRAKRRARPPLWRAAAGAVRTVCLGAALLIAAYVIYGLYFFAGSPAPSVDYLQRVNAVAAAVPDDERAWPLYRAALVQLDDAGDLGRSFNRWPRPGEDGWDEVAPYLDGHAEALALARQAAARPGLGYVAGHRIRAEDRALWPEEEEAFHADSALAESLVNVRLPHLAKMRSLARLFAADARRAAAAGDGAIVVADLAAMIGMAGQVQEAPILINDLVAISIVRMAIETAGDVLVVAPEALTDRDLKALAHRLGATDHILQVHLAGERMFFEDIIQRMFTDDGDGDGRVTAEGLRLLGGLSAGGGTLDQVLPVGDAAFGPAAPALCMLMASRREMVEEYNRVMDAFEAEASLPLWEMQGRQPARWLEQLMDGDASVQRIRMLPLAMLTPAMGSATRNPQYTVAQRDALLAAIAMELYRRREGAWPPSLETLVPELLPAMPRDRFDGRSLRYALIDGRPLLYSVGADRDDDGGQPPMSERSGRPDYEQAKQWIAPAELARRKQAGQAIPDGDWLLWPRPVEPIRRHD